MHKQYHVLSGMLSLLITINVHTSFKSPLTKKSVDFEQGVVGDVCSQIRSAKIKIAQVQKLDWSNMRYVNNKDLKQQVGDTVEQLQITTQKMIDILKYYRYDLGLKHQSSVMLYKQRLVQYSGFEYSKIDKVVNDLECVYEKLGFLVATDQAFQDISQNCASFLESFYPDLDPIELKAKRPEAVILLALAQRRILESLNFELWYATMCAASKSRQDINC